jgi:hypothetical protein
METVPGIVGPRPVRGKLFGPAGIINVGLTLNVALSLRERNEREDDPPGA